jgi:hypothetical protein
MCVPRRNGWILVLYLPPKEEAIRSCRETHGRAGFCPYLQLNDALVLGVTTLKYRRWQRSDCVEVSV